MAKNIYFLGGKLNRWEKEKLFAKYEKKLRSAVAEYSSADFKFVAVEDVTRARFQQVWTDKDTFGIFWFGHGTPSGLPATNEPSGNFYVTLNPLLLPKAHQNVQFLALLSCFSKSYEKEWREKMPCRFPQVATFKYTIEGFTGEMNDQIDRWIEKKRFLTSPTSGAHGLLRSAQSRVIADDFFSTPTPKLISFDYFEPDHAYVKTVTIPKVTTPANTRRVVPPRTVKPVAPKKQQIVPTKGWNLIKHKGQWQIGAPSSLPGSHTGGIQGTPHTTIGTGSSLRTRKIGQDAEAFRKRTANITAAKSGRGRNIGDGFRPIVGPKPQGGHLPSPHGDVDFGNIRVIYSPKRHVTIKTPGF